MTFRYLDIELTVQTVNHSSQFHADFTAGLNVLQAPNSWGKSTLVQSLVFGLGLEGAFSTSHLSPLGEAMSSVVDFDGLREAVVESSVTLTLENGLGQVLRVRRFAQSLTYRLDLIQTWSAGSTNALSQAEQKDYFVRQSGGATHELGFHRLLERFIGLDLPEVPGFNGEDVKLYLEVLLPLFYIEQKYGWSGLAPRVPTHYRIRSPYRRAAEFVLGLGSLERLKARDRLSNRLSQLNAELEVATQELNERLATQGWSLSRAFGGVANTEINDPEISVGVRSGDQWTPIDELLSEMRSRLAEFSNLTVLPASDHTETAKAELADAEASLSSHSGRYRAQQEILSSARAETDSLETRHAELQTNREALLDVRKLERLGSEVHSSALGSAHCPTCAQSLDSELVATGLVMDIADNLALLEAERTTLNKLIAASTRQIQLQIASAEATRTEINDARARIRSLKDELSGPSGAPSIAQVQERLLLAERIRVGEIESARAHSILEALKINALAILRVREELRELRADEEDGGDALIIGTFRRRFTDALERFGLRSLPVSEVTVGADSLLPEQGGFELTFDIRHGLSASDAIRTKWAHYAAIAEVSSSSEGGNPLGVLIMDEPRQQEAEFDSVRALYIELARVGSSTQVIVASSASDADLARLLQDLDVNLVRTTGTHMFAIEH